jgi:hypothetical protein
VHPMATVGHTPVAPRAGAAGSMSASPAASSSRVTRVGGAEPRGSFEPALLN